MRGTASVKSTTLKFTRGSVKAIGLLSGRGEMLNWDSGVSSKKKYPELAELPALSRLYPEFRAWSNSG
jgi:hypothetical protein